jgi:hypothetical protein
VYTKLRQWFGHNPVKWDEFKRRYFAELDLKPEVLQGFVARIAKTAGGYCMMAARSDAEASCLISTTNPAVTSFPSLNTVSPIGLNTMLRCNGGAT